MSTPDRLVIVAPTWLGDAILALPLMADVRRAWPEVQVTVAARRSVAPIFGMVESVNGVLALEGGGGLAALAATKKNADILRAGGFDTALLLPNSFLAAWIAARAGIEERWGFRTDWRRRLLTRAVRAPGKNAVHQAEYYQALGTALGIPNGPRYARVTVGDDIRRRARALLADTGLSVEREFVAMAPGAAYGRAKQWPPERFAELARMLADERGMATVLVGTAADARVCGEITSGTRYQVPGTRYQVPGTSGARNQVPVIVDLAGRTDLETLAGVLALAEAVVSNDSGAMHLAAAVGTKVVAVFGATNEKKSAPLAAGPDAPSAALVRTDVWCRPCMLRECPIDHRCMTGISARAVYDQL